MRPEDGIRWRRSSFSGTNGDCVEVGWRRSSFSGGGDDCVEVGWPDSSVAVRDSKQESGPVLGFPVPDWRAFLASLPR